MAVPTSTLTAVATAAYLANCTLGTSVRTGAVDSSGFRWLHHALYIATIGATATAAATGLLRGSVKGALLAPALLPLAFLPFIGREVHTAVGLAPAPWFIASALVKERG